ncbi:MAG: DNA-3-methyladenine glycosylase 2 family protein [Acidobacteriota bacterium]|nr:DNA-3-methyladenine glycosylase 2 family protein [Acidobacteriota bacterium]MDH3784176.1 DNA-3-methyladenine glycosylase 2 family protein [Acidobacteriota bacterium]
MKRLDGAGIAAAARRLASIDDGLATLLREDGVPPLWGRAPSYATLVRIILEQQVSLASARSVYRRLQQAHGPLTPSKIRASGADGLRGCGVTRQKARYMGLIAEEIDSGRLDLTGLSRLDDDAVRRTLTAITGIGPWTAECYLLVALKRPDVWPAGDIALQEAVRVLRGLKKRPDLDRLTDLADDWRPHRATAARMLWQRYLKGR